MENTQSENKQIIKMHSLELKAIYSNMKELKKISKRLNKLEKQNERQRKK